MVDPSPIYHKKPLRQLTSDFAFLKELAKKSFFEVYVHWDKLFTFIEQEGVEPTNNVSERALRLFVLIRKITYGNRSAKGEIALARILTVIQTCKLQQRPLLSYLVTAVHCHRRRQPAPSLRPLQNQQI